MNTDAPEGGRLSSEEKRRIERAVERGIGAYLERRRAKIPEFVERYFSFKGALALHKRTLGRDFYKIPLNMLWSLPAFLVQCTGLVLEKAGAGRLGRVLGRLPMGLRTEFQREINWLIQTELLELPYAAGARVSTKDALLEAILDDPELSAECAAYLLAIHRGSETSAFREALESNLAEYGKSRLASAELAGNLLNLAAGYAAFQKTTPGVFSAGSAAATAIAQHVAIANFWLGPSIGAWYYSVFPASASLSLLAAATGTLMAATGILVALSAVLLDPLLAKTGFHRKRLERFVQALGDELSARTEDPYRVKDHYYARVFDLLDLLKTAAHAAK